MGFFQNDVFLEPEQHRYFSKSTRREYKSVSRLFDFVKEPFDTKGQSWQSAGKIIREDTSGKKMNQEEVAAQLRKDWKDNNKRSTDHGTRVHDALELFGQTTQVKDKELDKCVRSVYHMLRHYPVTYQEEVVYSNKYGVAGTMDKPCMRTTGKKSIVDIKDYKTNVSKGIQYKSNYGKWLKEPLNYLEECNYIEYAIKISVYGVLLEELGFRPGSMSLIYIDPFELDNPKEIPLPYMKMEAEALLRMNLTWNQEIMDSTRQPFKTLQPNESYFDNEF